MEKLNITLVQPEIVWEDAQMNLKRYTEMLAPVERTDIIVLPEMFTTGFSMQPEKLKESMDGQSVKWMKKLAVEKGAAITGSLIIEDAGKVFNRLVWVFPDGKTEIYDKRHLFTMGEENEHYSAGTEKLFVEFKSWRFCPLICYDLRFPVWSRNTENYDVLLYVANWPAVRHDVWRTLLQARAIENQSYCIGVNRIGKDGSGIEHNGDSCMIDARGNAKFMGSEEQVTSFVISLDELREFRAKFPVLKDRDEFQMGAANSDSPI